MVEWGWEDPRWMVVIMEGQARMRTVTIFFDICVHNTFNMYEYYCTSLRKSWPTNVN